jgi:hypothetical protein
VHQQKVKDNEGTTKDKKRKAPTRKNPHERSTIKGLRIGSKTKISRFGLQGKGFDKTSANKEKNQERNCPQAMPLSTKAVAF